MSRRGGGKTVLQAVQAHSRSTADYAVQESHVESSKLHMSGYARFINGLKPFDRRNAEYISRIDQLQMIQAIKTEEFERILDLEITNANNIRDYITDLEFTASELIEAIEAYLD